MEKIVNSHPSVCRENCLAERTAVTTVSETPRMGGEGINLQEQKVFNILPDLHINFFRPK